MNQEAVRLQEESVVSRYDKIGAKVYFTTHKMHWQPVSIAGISAFSDYGMIGGFLGEILVEIIGGFVSFFEGEEARKRYDYEKKVKPRIRKALNNCVLDLSYEYQKAMNEAIERLRVQCEECRDDSFAGDLGEKNRTSEMKKKLQELTGKDTDFIYTEKNLKDLLLTGEERV